MFLLTPSLAYEIQSPSSIYGILVFLILFIVSATALVPVFDKGAVFIALVLAALIVYIVFFYGVNFNISAISHLGAIQKLIPSDAKMLAAILCYAYGIYSIFVKNVSYMKILLVGVFGAILLYPEVDFYTSGLAYTFAVIVLLFVKTKKP